MSAGLDSDTRRENHPGILSVLTPKYAYGSTQDMLFFSWMPFEVLGSFDNALSNDFAKDVLIATL